jgi:diadenosine tetraphosphate (Ap4A) HIT family hydrolase
MPSATRAQAFVARGCSPDTRAGLDLERSLAHAKSMSDRSSSPFLAIEPSAWAASNPLAFAIRDQYPVSPGHTLIVPRRLVQTWFEATREEQSALLELVGVVKRALDIELRPDGYNVGFNVGEAAGQTVMHLHVHLIPRFRGDVADPRGGVRHVIPSRGNWDSLAPKR